MTILHELNSLEQTVWFDFIRRSFTRAGKLQDLIDKGVRGVTSNPSIFEKAIAGSDDYDADIQRFADTESSATEIFESLPIADIKEADDILRPVYDQSNGQDGFVSMEVSPMLAHDTDGTIADAKRLFALVDKPNLMIKIPATPEGIPAVKAVISAGINVNVTLIFSLAQCEATAETYLAGLEALKANGGDLIKVASVASFFISRVDTAIDKLLATLGHTEFQGHAAVDNTRLAYLRFRNIFSGDRWHKLEQSGAHVQRLLWASTGTKNPNYPDTFYVDNLIGPYTVNTLPPATLDAFMDHGEVTISTENDIDGARARRISMVADGIDFDAIEAKLLDDGVAAFANAYESLLSSITEKKATLTKLIRN